MPGYVERGDEVRFGDLFDAPFLYDAFLKGDAVHLGTHEMGAYLRKTIAERYGRPDLADASGEAAYTSWIPQRAGEDHLLAHGRRCRALLVSENCAIDDAYGRPGQKRTGRLLFAAVWDAKSEEIAELQENPTFDRFPLPEAELMKPGGVADLRRVFMVDAPVAAPSLRFASLDDEAAEDLAVWWSAFATRHGPLSARRNAEKLVALLARAHGREPSADDLRTGEAVAEVINATWLLEGADLDAVGVAYDENLSPDAALQQVASGLQRVVDATTRALVALRSGLPRRS